jgi:DMSO/TMAO reductase YedYZ molybdopterin-dependent catalytic subunit
MVLPRPALAGVLGAGTSLAVGELGAAVVPSVPSPVDAVGQLVVDAAPGAIVTGAIATFGSANRPLLALGTVAVVLLVGAAVGVFTPARPRLAPLVFGGAAALGAAAGLAAPGARLVPVVVVLGLAAGLGLVVIRRAATPTPGDDAPVAAVEGRDPRAPAMPRRAVLGVGLAVGAALLVAAVGARRWSGVGSDLPAVALPTPARALPDLGPDLAASLEGVTPAMTPIEDFFRIDTALRVPRVDLATWRLRIHGRVEREVTLTYDELLALPLHEVDATIVCVSNEVGGELVGTARWLGVPLADVLTRAGVRPDAEQLVARSLDGWTAGFPVGVALDGRDALVAVGMQGAPLPGRHGFPARLVVPGLYGYVSATKWLTELELTAWDGVDGYWIPRGWAKRAPIKTASRIDVPRPGSTLPAGPTTVAGVAWAPTRGIRRVEIAVDDAGWTAATLVPVATADTWAQWRVEVDLPAGRHALSVRAVDGEGHLQPAGPRPPAPDGAEGWHRVVVEVA